MNDAGLSTAYLGLPLLLIASLLLALRIALFARAASSWASLFGGLAGLATVWLFGTVVLDSVWDALSLPKETLGMWPPMPTAIATLLALPIGAWLERRLRAQELGPILTGVLDGCTPHGAYEWAASIGFLAFAAVLAVMFSVTLPAEPSLSVSLIWLGVGGAVATGGGLLAGACSSLRGPRPRTRAVLMLLAGLTWCTLMHGLALRMERESRDQLVRAKQAIDFSSGLPEGLLAWDDRSPEEGARYSEMEAAWLYQNEGVIAEYKNAQGELVRYDPSGQMQAYVQYLSLLPAMAREAEANARRFAALWPFVALAGIALGVLRPRRATWGAPSG